MTVITAILNISQRGKWKTWPEVTAQIYTSVRNLSTLEVSKNLEIISNTKQSIGSNWKISGNEDKPLVVMIQWLLAKRKHLMKYANIYLEQGLDVLNVQISPWELLWPAKGSQLVAADLVKFLEVNTHCRPLFVHGFSVAGYLFGEVLVQFAREKERYQQVIDRFIGQVWDSAVDVTEISRGVSLSVFPRNPVMQAAMRQYVEYHQKTFSKVATCHHIRASQMFHTNAVKAPALFLLSSVDPLGSYDSNNRVRENWESMGTEVYWKCFKKSPHVGHMQLYQDEYLKEVKNHIERVGLKAKQPLKARITV